MNINTFLKLQTLDFTDQSPENQIKMVETLSSKSSNDLSVSEFYSEMQKINAELSAFYTRFSESVCLNSKTLKYHSIEKLSARQFIDFDNLNRNKDQNDTFTTLLAIIYTDDNGTDSYADDIKSNKELIETYMSAEEALGAINFFVLGSIKYFADTQISSEMLEKYPEIKKNYDQIQTAFKNYQNITGGI